MHWNPEEKPHTPLWKNKPQANTDSWLKGLILEDEDMLPPESSLPADSKPVYLFRSVDEKLCKESGCFNRGHGL